MYVYYHPIYIKTMAQINYNFMNLCWKAHSYYFYYFKKVYKNCNIAIQINNAVFRSLFFKLIAIIHKDKGEKFYNYCYNKWERYHLLLMRTDVGLTLLLASVVVGAESGSRLHLIGKQKRKALFLCQTWLKSSL